MSNLKLSTVQALKKLYVTLGGNAADVADITLIPDMINAIAALDITGGTSELPEVTADDNGKILKVVDGEWAAAAETPSAQTEQNS